MPIISLPSPTPRPTARRARGFGLLQVLLLIAVMAGLASMGYLHLPIPALDLLMMDLQPGSLGVRAGRLIGERESEILRASALREELSRLTNL